MPTHLVVSATGVQRLLAFMATSGLVLGVLGIATAYASLPATPDRPRLTSHA